MTKSEKRDLIKIKRGTKAGWVIAFTNLVQLSSLLISLITILSDRLAVTQDPAPFPSEQALTAKWTTDGKVPSFRLLFHAQGLW